MTEDITIKRCSPQSEPPMTGTFVTSQITFLLSLIIVSGKTFFKQFFVLVYGKSPYLSCLAPQMRRKIEIPTTIVQSPLLEHDKVSSVLGDHRSSSSTIDVRAGGAGGPQPPKFWANQIFWAAREIWAKPVFKEVSMLVGLITPVKFTP